MGLRHGNFAGVVAGAHMGRGGGVVSALDVDVKVGSSRPNPCHSVFLDKKLLLRTASPFPPKAYK